MCPHHYEPDLPSPLLSDHTFDLQWQHRLKAGIFKELDQSFIQLLIQVGANPLAKNKAGLTPLMHALRLGSKNQKNIETIILYSKTEEIDKGDNEGYTALNYLAKMEMEKRAFLNNGTQVKKKMFDRKYTYFSALA